jgi:hypothetical protein
METTLALALLLILAAAIYVAEHAATRGWTARKKRRSGIDPAFPKATTRETHWQRTTAVVERAITRAADMAANHAAAARQLEAADYALHSLLHELGGVMKATVGSPLGARPVPEAARAQPQTALAA